MIEFYRCLFFFLRTNILNEKIIKLKKIIEIMFIKMLLATIFLILIFGKFFSQQFSWLKVISLLHKAFGWTEVQWLGWDQCITRPISFLFFFFWTINDKLRPLTFSKPANTWAACCTHMNFGMTFALIKWLDNEQKNCFTRKTSA